MHILDLFNEADRNFLNGSPLGEGDIVQFPGRKPVRKLEPAGSSDHSDNVVSISTGPKSQSSSVKELAREIDILLDRGRSAPGLNFDWLSNINMAMFAKRAVESGESNIDKIAAAVHKGWSTVAIADHKNKLPMDPPTAQDVKLRRLRLAQKTFDQLDDADKRKYRLIATTLLNKISNMPTEPGPELAEGDVIRMPTQGKLDFDGPVVNVKPADVIPFEPIKDTGSRKLEIWKQRVRAAHPEYGDKIRFVSKDNGKHISAEAPGVDRSFGVFDIESEKGYLLDENSQRVAEEEKKGLYYYVNKRKKAGTSRPKNHPKAPSAQDWKNAAKTAKKESVEEGQLEFNTPDPVVVIADSKTGKILDQMNLSTAAQKYRLGSPDNIKKQLAHQSSTTIGNYRIQAPMTGQPQDSTTQGVAEAGFPGAPDVEMTPMKPSGDPQRDKLKQEYVDIHREIKSLVDIPYRSDTTPNQKAQAKARINQLNIRADEIKAILEPRQLPNEWQKKTYGYDDNWNIVKKGVAESSEDDPVAQAIIRRILTQRQDLLKYGADLVGDAIDDVASFVGHVDEIGTSDVSAWVKQVEDYVKRTAQGRGDRLNEISDESLIKYLVGVHQDALKHKSDPTKRKPEKASKSVSGFSRAFNKLDARQAQELAPRVGEDIDNDTKSATFDPIKYHDFMKQNDELFRGMSSALQRRDENTYQKLLKQYLSLHDRGSKGMVPEAAEEKSEKPRIRKYSKLRPDGSKAVRYEVLDYRGMRIPGQGTEGFDDLKYAKEFFHRNYDKLSDPLDEQTQETVVDEPIREVAGRYWCKNEKRWKNVE